MQRVMGQLEAAVLILDNVESDVMRHGVHGNGRTGDYLESMGYIAQARRACRMAMKLTAGEDPATDTIKEKSDDRANHQQPRR